MSNPTPRARDNGLERTSPAMIDYVQSVRLTRIPTVLRQRLVMWPGVRFHIGRQRSAGQQ